MIDFKPSIFSLVRLTFGDTLRIFRAIPDLAITAFLVSIGHSLVRTVVIEGGLKTGRELIAAVLGLGFVFLLMPFLIAAHRFIVLGEVARGYSFDAPNPRVLRFYGTWIILGIVAAVPTMLAIALAVAAHKLAWWIIGAIALPFVVGLTILCLRMTILLPAIAIDAPGANWLNAYHDTRGHTLGIFLIYLAVLVLYVLAATVVYTLFFVFTALLAVLFFAMAVALPAGAALAKVLAILVVNAVTLIGLTQFVAVASRLYQMLGDHVKNPPSEVQTV